MTGQISKRNLDRAQRAIAYFKQAGGDKETCCAIARRMKQLIHAKAGAEAFIALEQECTTAGIAGMGVGGGELHGSIIALISDLKREGT